MKYYCITTLFLLAACQNPKTTPIVKKSSGNINTITVVIPDLLWEQNVGEAVRAAFAYPAEGLPQQEPLFDLKQMPPEVFNGFARSSRMVLWVGLSNDVVLKVDKNRYASPQKMAVLSTNSKNDLAEMILSQAPSIINEFKKGEIKERKRRITKSLLKQDILSNKFGIRLLIPSTYKVIKQGAQAVWMQREITKGHVNFLICSLPRSTKIDIKSPLKDIIAIRDSIGKAFLPGRLPGTYSITESAYEPYTYYTKVGGLNTIETRGTWEVKGDFMAGPFLQFLLDDSANNRYLLMEGFVFAPSQAKRDYIFETEAIMRSISKIVKN